MIFFTQSLIIQHVLILPYFCESLHTRLECSVECYYITQFHWCGILWYMHVPLTPCFSVLEQLVGSKWLLTSGFANQLQKGHPQYL